MEKQEIPGAEVLQWTYTQPFSKIKNVQGMLNKQQKMTSKGLVF